jgi:hypothetical protein
MRDHRASVRQGRADSTAESRRREPEETPARVLPMAQVIALQRSAGNQAVTAMLARVDKPKRKRKPPPEEEETAKKSKPDLSDLTLEDVKEGPQEEEPDEEEFEYETNPHTKVDAKQPDRKWTIKRPTLVKGPVRGLTNQRRPPTARPLAYEQESTGTVPAEPELPFGYDGGHIVGLQLGGPNDSRNVVPMYPGFNRGKWLTMENKFHPKITGDGFTMKVELDYGLGDEIPYKLKATLEGPPLAAPIVEQWSQPTDIPDLPEPSDEVGAILNRPDRTEDRGVTTARSQEFKDLKFDLRHPKDNTKTHAGFLEYVSAEGQLPPSMKPLYPDKPADRPYERLDVLNLSGEIEDTTQRLGGNDFSTEQIRLILQANRVRNGGTLKSDAPNDPCKTLDVKGAANHPEIDHIIPKSSGGSNYYSNARVVSWQVNNKTDRVKSLKGLFDVSKLQLPTVPRRPRDAAKVFVYQALQRGAVDEPFDVAAIANWAVRAFELHKPVDDKRRTLMKTELDLLVAEGALIAVDGKYRTAPELE